MGIVGFSNVGGSFIWHIAVVRGRRCYSIPVPYPVYLVIHTVWKHHTARAVKRLRNKYKKT